jgi:hypothetical protein
MGIVGPMTAGRPNSETGESMAKRRFVLAVAFFGVLAGVLVGIVIGERIFSAIPGDPRAARGPTILFLLDAFFTYAFVRVIIDHFRKK